MMFATKCRCPHPTLPCVLILPLARTLLPLVVALIAFDGIICFLILVFTEVTYIDFAIFFFFSFV